MSSDAPSAQPTRRRFPRSALGTMAAAPFAGQLLAQNENAAPTKPADSQEILILGA